MKAGLTDINIVLDRSGSMGSVRSDTIHGFNTFIDDQKAAPGEAVLTLAQFDNEYEIVYNAIPLQKADHLDNNTYQPRGTTALLDAIGRTIDEAGSRIGKLPEEERPEKVLLVVMTDGAENASREYSREKVFSMITHQRDKYSWQVVFIGANQDSIGTAGGIGIPASNAINYQATGQGTRAAVQRLSAATKSYRVAGGQSVGGFFDDGGGDGSQ